MDKPRVMLAWSSGKDSAWALHCLRQEARVEVVSLLTTVTQPFARVSMHGVREEILSLQARAAGLGCIRVEIPAPCSDEVYRERMAAAMEKARRQGVQQVAFGDLFLQDIRAYRERQLQSVGMQAVFPLWGIDTRAMAHGMIDQGLEAIVTCVDPRAVPGDLAGRAYDRSFLEALPEGVDPAGENGEFHTLVTGGPMFSHRLEVVGGEVVERDGFVFADVIPVRSQGSG
jgi:uncharacterized protein (TIGR00290 family)